MDRLRPDQPFPTAPDRLPPPCRVEAEVAAALRASASGSWDGVLSLAGPWVEAVRQHPAPFWALESLLKDYPLSSAEGRALMRLAEALLRVPDADTAIALTADQLGQAEFSAAQDSAHPAWAALSASVLGLSRRWLPSDGEEPSLVARLGARTVVAATVRAIQLLGRQFVLGRDIAEATEHAQSARRTQPALRYSYDMLGEGARTDADAERYLQAYHGALAHLQACAEATPVDTRAADGLSVKLSALCCRFEPAQASQWATSLLPRVWTLVDAAARAHIPLTLDAEESDRLELSLDVFEALAQRVAAEHPAWTGLGLAVQAYQTRSLEVVHEVARIARVHGLQIMVRLVKGAYWDAEIKRAQELGLAGYPVFTHKHHTDLSYLACARALFAHADVIYPQFATHNAGTLAAVARMAEKAGTPCELQRLHGMGEAVYGQAMAVLTLPVRVYAPVGAYRELLAYLVRRLLENGANSSFVHALNDPAVDVGALLVSPLFVTQAEGQPLPCVRRGQRRKLASGVDLAVQSEREPLESAVQATRLQPVSPTLPSSVPEVMATLQAGFDGWHRTSLAHRVAVLQAVADLLALRLPEFCGLLVVEANKTLGDAVAEVREAIDFCRYYAEQAAQTLAPQNLPGPTGETNTLNLRGRGVFACISPWNFPLAIFIGQVAAALVAGNAVAAKPSELTPRVASRAVALCHEAGVPSDVLQLLHGPGSQLGTALVGHALTAGVCFTGSTGVARQIVRRLAEGEGPIVPLLAETGGINAMLVDSSALPEQAVDAIVHSAFRSAGQRCSALRLLCVHEDIADAVLSLLAGAMQALVLGDAREWRTDIGPVIDAAAAGRLQNSIAQLERSARLIARTPLVAGQAVPNLIAPVAFERQHVQDVDAEIFGPVLQVVRWKGSSEAVIAQVNALGYGLTLGLQTRIDSRAVRWAQQARVGNVYVNRHMVGAVVGEQPFGGEGLSGTGPKAGGPHYLLRFCSEQVVSINTAAAGGNAALLSGVPLGPVAGVAVAGVHGP